MSDDEKDNGCSKDTFSWNNIINNIDDQTCSVNSAKYDVIIDSCLFSINMA